MTFSQSLTVAVRVSKLDYMHAIQPAGLIVIDLGVKNSKSTKPVIVTCFCHNSCCLPCHVYGELIFQLGFRH